MADGGTATAVIDRHGHDDRHDRGHRGRMERPTTTDRRWTRQPPLVIAATRAASSTIGPPAPRYVVRHRPAYHGGYYGAAAAGSRRSLLRLPRLRADLRRPRLPRLSACARRRAVITGDAATPATSCWSRWRPASSRISCPATTEPAWRRRDTEGRVVRPRSFSCAAAGVRHRATIRRPSPPSWSANVPARCPYRRLRPRTGRGHRVREPPPGRPRRADRVGELRQPARDRGPGQPC